MDGVGGWREVREVVGGGGRCRGKVGQVQGGGGGGGERRVEGGEERGHEADRRGAHGRRRYRWKTAHSKAAHSREGARCLSGQRRRWHCEQPGVTVWVA